MGIISSAAVSGPNSLKKVSELVAGYSILLVTWYFPPDNSIAAIRLGKMARYLEQAGHRIRVAVPDISTGDRSLPVEIDEEAISRIRYLDLDGRLNPVTRFQAETPAHAPSDGEAEAKTPFWRRFIITRGGFLSRVYEDVILYPDRRIDWSPTLLSGLFRMIKAERPDLILASGPPFSCFISAAIAARRFGIPWIAEFRDRWVDDPYEPGPSWRAPIDRWVERQLVSRSAGIVTVSDLWADFYRDKYGLSTETVMNGFDPRDFAIDGEPPKELPLQILHAGSIYPERRDPKALFEAIRRSGYGPEVIRLQFYGQSTQALREQAEAMGVQDVVELKNAIPYKDALSLQKRSDVLLLLQWNNPAEEGNVPAKIFEYLAINRQILGLGPLNGVPARLVRERSAGLFSNDPDEIGVQLKSWIEEKQRTGHVAPPPPDAASGLERDDQYRRLDDFCQMLTRGKSSLAGREVKNPAALV